MLPSHGDNAQRQTDPPQSFLPLSHLQSQQPQQLDFDAIEYAIDEKYRGVLQTAKAYVAALEETDEYLTDNVAVLPDRGSPLGRTPKLCNSVDPLNDNSVNAYTRFSPAQPLLDPNTPILPAQRNCDSISPNNAKRQKTMVDPFLSLAASNLDQPSLFQAKELYPSSPFTVSEERKQKQHTQSPSPNHRWKSFALQPIPPFRRKEIKDVPWIEENQDLADNKENRESVELTRPVRRHNSTISKNVLRTDGRVNKMTFSSKGLKNDKNDDATFAKNETVYRDEEIRPAISNQSKGTPMPLSSLNTNRLSQKGLEKHDNITKQFLKKGHHNIKVTEKTNRTKISAGLTGDLLLHGQTYTVVNLIGQGGSSAVYRVLHKESKELLALKRVATKHLSRQTTMSYRNEINFLLKLRKHCNCIPFLRDYEYERSSGILHMVLELGEIDFANYMMLQRSKPFNWNFIRWYGQQMLEAVAEIHDLYVVHRDLKPANFILKEGSLKLIDFGISRKVDVEKGTVQIDIPIGTINYMPPEAFLHVQNDQGSFLEIGRPLDIWALGCIFYQMIYGRTPFHNVHADLKAKRICDPHYIIDYPAVVHSDLPVTKRDPLPSSRNQISIPVGKDPVDILQHCLERDPAKRWLARRLLDHPFFRPEGER